MVFIFAIATVFKTVSEFCWTEKNEIEKFDIWTFERVIKIILFLNIFLLSLQKVILFCKIVVLPLLSFQRQ